MAATQVEITKDGETMTVSAPAVRVWAKKGWTLVGSDPQPTLFEESDESEKNSSDETDEQESDMNHQAADPEEN
jgi:hypothetical protein